MSTLPTLPLAVSCGDPSGIGPDLILQAWAQRQALALPAFVVLGDPDQLAARANTFGLDVPIATVAGNDSGEAFASALPVMPLENRFDEAPGKPLAANAAGVIEAIERAVALTMSGQAEAVVTAPIAKKPLYDAGFSHPGHTEFLADLAAQHTGEAVRPVMMIAGPTLRTIPVTIHLPLAAVPAALTTGDIVETIAIAARDLKARFGLVTPRIAVSGLNPHAGEDGALGEEDRTVIAPAIEDVRARGIDATGPLPADAMFHEAARETYDVAVCMYHDQALIPAKALDFDLGVNITLGLPFVRTSPDHGTAFSLAGTGKARPDSFIAALKMAAQMTQTRSADP